MERIHSGGGVRLVPRTMLTASTSSISRCRDVKDLQDAIFFGRADRFLLDDVADCVTSSGPSWPFICVCAMPPVPIGASLVVIDL